MKITLLYIFLIGFFMAKTNAEPMFKSNSPSTLSIDGSAMKALKIACDEFLVSGKDIREFNINISEKLTKTKPMQITFSSLRLWENSPQEKEGLVPQIASQIQ